MNFSNTFFPLASTLPTLPLHSFQNPLSNALNPNFNFINPLLLSSSTSLNNKRYIDPSGFPALTEPNILASNTKRHKPNGDIQSIVLLSPEQISTQGKGSKLPGQEIITIDEDEDCVILEQPANRTQGRVTSFGSDQIGGLSEFNYAGLLNQVNKRNLDIGANNLLNFNKNLGLGPEIPHQDIFLYEVFKNSYMNTLQQNLMNTQNFPQINQINQNNHALLQTNFNQQLQSQIVNSALNDAIVIDDDLIMPEPQQPVVEKPKRPVISDSDKLANLLGRRDKVKSINKSMTTTKTNSEKVEKITKWEDVNDNASNPDITQADSDKTDPSSPLSIDKIIATIPPLEKRGEAPLKKSRKIKQKWDPTSLDRAEIEKYLQEVDRITSIENANEEKALEALKEHKMNVELTLEKIKRNKAHYKNQLRVHRIDRLRAQYY